MFRRILAGTLLLSTLLLTALAGAQGVFANVPEASNYTLDYQLNIGSAATSYDSGSIPYAVNNSASIAPGSFYRVAYYLELSGSTVAGDKNGFIYVSFDASGFATSANKIGVPNISSGEFYQQSISNMDIVSNVPGITTGTGLSGGSIQFWPSNFDTANSTGVPNASNSTYDWGDSAENGAGYGAMQIADAAASQELLNYNGWGLKGSNGPADLGIGSKASGNPSWVFSSNAPDYTVKTLDILVETTSTATPEPGSAALLVALGVVGTGLLRRRRK